MNKMSVLTEPDSLSAGWEQIINDLTLTSGTIESKQLTDKRPVSVINNMLDSV